MKYLIPIITLAALAGCADTESADEAQDRAAAIEPEPLPARVVEPTPAGDDGTPGSDRVAQGSWTGKTERGVPMALFGEADTEAAFVVRCEDDTLVFARSALLPASEASMRLTAGGQTRRLVASAEEDPLPQVIASLPASDPFAGTLARSAEPIAVTVGDGGETYPMPSSPVLRGVVAGCMPG